ncbi:MAG: toll/interleukin-1 receptor domain-containing protein [Candidatus Stygibacter australis]|nr:toll/interleukin-1 receptor domain-containing protein [Candidatus Stygibacter australis]
MQKPNVFISYCWSNQAHDEWVLKFAERMMSENINVIFDKKELKLGHALNHFMEESIEKSDKVLIICNKKYTEKANSRSGGVGIETSIINPSVYSNTKQEKFIPVFKEKDENGDFYVPIFLKNRLGIDFTQENQFENKIAELCNVILNNSSYPKLKSGISSESTNEKMSKTSSKDFDFNINILFSSIYSGNSQNGTLSNATRTVQVDILNIGNKINYVDYIKFCTVRDNTKKYHHILFNPNDIVFKDINPEFGLPINVGKKVTYHYPIDDLLKPILKADNKLNFSVIINDELGNIYEKNVDEQYISDIKKYCIKQGYVFSDKQRKTNKILNNSRISKSEILEMIYQNPFPNWECYDDESTFILKEDINLKIVRDDFDNRRPFNEKWATSHPDKMAYANYYFVYYNNNLVDKFLLVAVDGNRAELPLPKSGTNIIKKEFYLKAKAVDILGTLDEYIDRSKLIVE